MDRCGYVGGLARIRKRTGSDTWTDWCGFVGRLVRIRGGLVSICGNGGIVEQMAEYGAQAGGEARMNRRDALWLRRRYARQ